MTNYTLLHSIKTSLLGAFLAEMPEPPDNTHYTIGRAPGGQYHSVGIVTQGPIENSHDLRQRAESVRSTVAHIENERERAAKALETLLHDRQMGVEQKGLMLVFGGTRSQTPALTENRHTLTIRRVHFDYNTIDGIEGFLDGAAWALTRLSGQTVN